MNGGPSASTRVREFWMARQPRERRVLGIGAAFLLMLLIWLSLIDPALKARSRWQQTLPAWRSQLAQMRAIAAEIAASPARSTAAVPVAELSRAGLERSLREKGLQVQNLTVSDRRVSANFSDVPFAALTEWLQQAQSSVRLVITEANITARDLPGRVDARLTLQRAQ